MGRKMTAMVSLLVLLFTLAACAQMSYPDEIYMMRGMLRYFDDPDNLTVSVLEKYEVSEKESYYYVEWMYPEDGDTDTHQFLVIYDTQLQLVQLVHFQDMEAGHKANVRKTWNQVKADGPDRSFTHKEIEEIIDEAVSLQKMIDEAA